MALRRRATSTSPEEPLPPWARAQDRRAFRHSPHLGQWRLHQRLAGLVRQAYQELGPGATVLEVGAGHGSYAGDLLAAGGRVTLAEMVPSALQAAVERWGANDRFSTLHDASAVLTDAPQDVDLVLLLSVLHHVPDYLSLLDRAAQRLRAGGSLVTLQDPLYYPRLDGLTRKADRLAYLTWRLGQGEVRAGARAALRRVRGAHPSASDGEITYYHVTRQGVDEEAVVRSLRPEFARVQLFTYWSNHLGAAAPAAERVGLRNTFAVRASGFRR